MELFAWQKACLQQWKNHGYHGIVNVITGAGKTVLALACAQHLLSRYPDLQIKIIVPTVILAHQWQSSCLGFFSNDEISASDVGLYYGTHQASNTCRIMIYVVNSARYRVTGHIKENLDDGHKVFLIADECHHYGSAENSRIFGFLHLDPTGDLVYTIGLSATPDCENYSSVLVPSLGEEIYRYGVQNALMDKRVAPFRILQIAVNFNAKEGAQYASLCESISFLLPRLVKEYPQLKETSSSKEFSILLSQLSRLEDGAGTASSYRNLILKRRHLVHKAQSRKLCALDLIERQPPHVPILLFCEQIEEADTLYAFLQQIKPDQVSRYHSAMSKEGRKIALDEFRCHRSQILVSCKALDEGMDVPDATVGIIMSCTSTDRQRIQRMGRILRRGDEHKVALLYYLYVAGAVDEPVFLADQDLGPVINLRYLAEERDFLCDAYISRANAVLHRAAAVGMDKKKLEEIRRCVEHGLIRADWTLDLETYPDKIRHASNDHEKNYWIVMKLIRQGEPAKEQRTP